MYFETHIVDHCNLNCAGCAHFSPLVKEKRFKDLNEFKIELQRLLDVFGDDVVEFNLLGGETLLHPQVEEFISSARNILGNDVLIDLTTNGLLMKSKGEEFYNLLNSLKIRVKFTDYGLDIDKTFVEKINDILVTNQTHMFNISLNLNGTQNAELMYYLCPANWKDWHGNVFGGCILLKNGCLYNCAVAAYANDFERYFKFKFDESLDKMAINIFTHTKEEIMAFLTHPHEFCKYCNIYRLERSSAPMHKTEHKIEEWLDVNETIENFN